MGRYLKPNHTSRIPQFTGAVGCSWRTSPRNGSTLAVEESLASWCCDFARWHGDQWTRHGVASGNTPDSFAGFLADRLNPHRPLYLVADDAGRAAHWLGIFALIDQGILFWDESDCDDAVESAKKRKKKRMWRGTVAIEDPPIILRLWSRQGKLTLVDRRNYTQVERVRLLAGDGADLPAVPHPRWGEARHMEYAKATAAALASWWRETLAAWYRTDSGCWSHTAAALAWNSWRHTIGPKDVLIERHEERDRLERAAYYGGQCLALFLGDCRPAAEPATTRRRPNVKPVDGPPTGPFYHLDVRSFYPSLMRAEQFPCRVTKTTTQTTPATFQSLSRCFLPLGSVLIESPDVPYPVRRDGQTLFACGSFWTALAGPELLDAVRRGHVTRHGVTCWYLPGRLFGRFVDQWWQRRVDADKRGDVATVNLCKLVLNGLSGKFAQRTGQWRRAAETPPMKRWGQWTAVKGEEKALVRYRSLGGRVEVEQERTDAQNAFPAVSAYITAYGRVKMAELRSLCPPRSVLYQDTDSLIVTTAGLDALERAGAVQPEQLGGLLVKSVSDSLTIHNLKDYETEGGRTVAGVRADAEPVGPGVFRQRIQTRLGESLSMGPTITTIGHTMTLKLGRGYRAGRVDPSGWTRPMILDDVDTLPF